ncbi:DUF721 family protein [Gordonia soli]|uniref:UPF0232 protein GS4_04_00190 n=1 Tax=Gordonia soli NBRC 108243 TaxID=1223545 RepID=M0QH58_9ACTN|nr:DUF721 family protein [Gordonia soli]GAC66762.1 hypothetical protein GS4_04_00190 [Gordonia soli NBRC 108243]
MTPGEPLSPGDGDRSTGGEASDSAHRAVEPSDHGGYERARRALEEARAAARAAGKSVGHGRASPARGRARQSGTRRRWSGSGPDSRDPQSLGKLTGRIAAERGWQPKISEGALFGMWEQIVGSEIAAHANPTELRDNVLHIQAESTAWATQLRYVQAQILAKISSAAGDGIVTSLRITGPKGPSWRKGERHIRGRGPRDTYG